jgi:hypothetical protein
MGQGWRRGGKLRAQGTRPSEEDWSLFSEPWSRNLHSRSDNARYRPLTQAGFLLRAR